MNTSGFRMRGKLESTYDTDQFKPLSKPSREPAASTPSPRPKPAGNGLTVTLLTDWTLTLADINKHHKDDQTTPRAIMSAKAGLAMDSRCDRCGNDRDGTCHRFWECTALKSTYEEDSSLFQEFRYGEAPACLTTCGLAMELAGNVTGAFGASDGLRDQLQRKRKYDEWEQIHREMQVEGRTARHVFADYHGPDRILDIQLLPQILGESGPHSRPIHLQMLQSFCRGFRGPPTPGLASPTLFGRDTTTYPLHNIEIELTEPRGSETNRQHTTSSSINNSTRMELTAAIIATYAPRPITIAVDNQAVGKGFRRIKDRSHKSTDGLTSQTGICGSFGRKLSLRGVLKPSK